jgi:hypothetical protein
MKNLKQQIQVLLQLTKYVNYFVDRKGGEDPRFAEAADNTKQVASKCKEFFAYLGTLSRCNGRC